MRSPEIVVHGTRSLKDARQIFKEGFIAQSGRAIVSTDFIFGYEWALNPSGFVKDIPHDENGIILIMRVPSNLRVGLASEAGITVDHDKKFISGYIEKHRYSRRRLALYKTGGESQIVRIPPSNILLGIYPNEDLGEILLEMKKMSKNFAEINRCGVVESIIDTVTNNSANFVSEDIDIAEVINGLVSSTIETTTVNRIRSLSIDIMKTSGYKFDDFDSEVRQVNGAETKQLIKRYLLKVDGREFSIDGSTLDRYVKYFIRQYSRLLV